MEISNFAETTGVALRNLAITGGNFSTLGRDGAGVLTRSSISLDNVRVEDNHSAGGKGGGMYTDGVDDVDIIDSLFTHNSVGASDSSGPNSNSGGGLYMNVGTSDQATVQRTTFSFNTAAPDQPEGLSAKLGRGGGVFVSSGSADSTVLFEEVVIEQNVAYESGGGLEINAPSGTASSTGLIAVRNSIIRNNEALGKAPTEGFINTGFGGGAYISTGGQRVLLDGLSITGNSATPLEVSGSHEQTQSHGGGIFISALKPQGVAYSVEIVNTTVAENRANIGGGIAFSDNPFNAGRSVDATIIRHSTITANIAGELDIPGGIEAGKGRSNGGGISLGYFFDDIFDGSTIGRFTTYTGGLFLDHTIVTGNLHGDPFDPTVNNFNGAWDYNTPNVNEFDGAATAIAFSPDIGVTSGYKNYKIVGNSLELYDDATFGAEYATLGIDHSYLGTFSSTLLPESLLLSESETPPGTLTRIDSAEHGIFYAPGGSFVDAGKQSYAPDSLPQYKLSTVSGVIGTNDIEFDQRGAPFVRVSDPILGSVLGSRIDIGAVELQPHPTPAAPVVTNVLLSNGTETFDFAESGRIGSGAQVRQLPYQNLNTVTIEFSEPVNVPTSATGDGLRLLGAYGSDYPVDVIAGDGTTSVTWQIQNGGVLADKEMMLLNLSENVTDTDSNLLDGEWVNPLNTTVTNSAVSEFPSGDGTAGGAFNFSFVTFVTHGDFDGNNHVEGNDLTLLLDNWNKNVVDISSAWVLDLPTVKVAGDELTLMLDNWDIGFDEFQWLLAGNTNGAEEDGTTYVVDTIDAIAVGGNQGTQNPTRMTGDLTNDGLVDGDDITAFFTAMGISVQIVS